jgi:hypothetical protein
MVWQHIVHKHVVNDVLMHDMLPVLRGSGHGIFRLGILSFWALNLVIVTKMQNRNVLETGLYFSSCGAIY